MTQEEFQQLATGDNVLWYDDQERRSVPRVVLIGWRPGLSRQSVGTVVLLPTHDYGSQDVTSPAEVENA